MANMTEISKEMDELETEAVALLADREMTNTERRTAFGRLLARYGALEAHKAALAAFIAVTYDSGPRSAWVLTVFLPTFFPAVPRQ